MTPGEHAAKAAELVGEQTLLAQRRTVGDDKVALEQFDRLIGVAQVHALLAVAGEIKAYHHYVRKGE